MYVYYIRDDATGLYMIGRMKLGAPVMTCVWGEHRADAITFEGAAEARKALIESVGNTASIYRLDVSSGQATRIKLGGDSR